MSNIVPDYTRLIDPGVSVPQESNSEEILQDLFSGIFSRAITNIIHEKAYLSVEYRKPKVVVLSKWNCIKIALCTILTLGIWLYRQHSRFMQGLGIGDLEAAEEAATNGGSLFTEETAWSLAKEGKVESAIFLLAQKPDQLQEFAELLEKARLEYMCYNKQGSRELYRNALWAFIPSGPNEILRHHFYAVLERDGPEMAELFFQYRKTCADLIGDGGPSREASDAFFEEKNIRFLINHGLQADQSLPPNPDDHLVSTREGKTKLSGGTFLWHCVRLNEIKSARLILEKATAEQKSDIFGEEGPWLLRGTHNGLPVFMGPTTPMQLAKHKKNSLMLDLLREHGAE